jgi:hypothetical protein
MLRRSVLALTLLAALVFGPQSSVDAQPPPGLLGSYHWQGEGDRFGGFSAIEVSPDGQRFTALSDRGTWLTGRLLRDAEGRITGVEASAPEPLKGHRGSVLQNEWADTEGLTQLPDGSFVVSFEGRSRLRAYADLAGPASQLATLPAFGVMHPNGSLEAVASDAEGTVYAIAEDWPRPDEGFPVFRLRDGVWDRPFALPRDGAFLPAGADFGPDGGLYVLERQFRGPFGFASRVRSFHIDGDHLALTGTVLQSPLGLHDNLEGISVWRDAEGHLRLTMISDDNFRFLQRTEIVEYLIPG